MLFSFEQCISSPEKIVFILQIHLTVFLPNPAAHYDRYLGVVNVHHAVVTRGLTAVRCLSRWKPAGVGTEPMIPGCCSPNFSCGALTHSVNNMLDISKWSHWKHLHEAVLYERHILSCLSCLSQAMFGVPPFRKVPLGCILICFYLTKYWRYKIEWRGVKHVALFVSLLSRT